MAFNQPIEADKPDNLDLITTFSRAPIIGTLMWLFGGDMAMKLEEEERNESDNIIQTLDREREIENKKIIDKNINIVPDRILSDISECSIMESDGSMNLTKTFGDCSLSDRSEISHSMNQLHVTHSGMRRRMSWSDESGQSLVAYSNESSSRKPLSTTMPLKSVIKRSNSTYSNPLQRSSSNSSSESIQQTPSTDRKESPSAIVAKRYIPSLGGKMPHVGGGGYVSPQWGWYISTTPPSQEMYSSNKIDTHTKEEPANTNNNNLNRREVYKPPTTALPMFKHTTASPAHGWPNVPL